MSIEPPGAVTLHAEASAMRACLTVTRLTLVAMLCAGSSGCRSGVTAGRIQLADGIEQLALGDTTRARAALERARWELPDEPSAWTALARLDQAEGTIEGRVRARSKLLRAVDLAPDVAAYRIALGDLLRRQRYTRTGNQMLAEAVRLDPSAGEGWRLLGQAMLEAYLDEPEHEAARDSAIVCYERALAVDPGDLDAALALAFLALHQHRYARARTLLAPIVAADSCAHAALLLATAEFRSGQDARAEALLTHALACMSWGERETYVGLHAVLHPEDEPAWQRLTPAEQDSAAQLFWWERDPTPATWRNERLLEQVARVVEADWYFHVPLLEKPGWQTDRGEIYQRFGPPDYAARIEPRGWEWTYGHGSEHESFVFFDRYLNGDYLRPRRGAGSDYSRAELLDVQPEATCLALRPPREWKYTLQTFQGSDGRTAVDFVFELEPDPTWTQAQVEIAAWRGPDARIVDATRRIGNVDLFRLPQGAAVGRLRVEVPPDRLVLAIQAAGFAGASPAFNPTNLSQAAWLVGERDTVQVEDLQTDALALSDLVLAHQIEPGHGGLFDHGGIIVVPRVDTRIDTDQVALYFEVYASSAVLAAGHPLSLQYEVRSLPPPSFHFWDQFSSEKRARADPNRRPAVVARFSFRPLQPIEPRDLIIDVGNLEDGPYLLTVQVVDPQTGENATRSVQFDLDRAATLGVVTPSH